MKRNDLNEFGIRGCVINVVRMPFDEQAYLSEQEEYSKKCPQLDDLTMQLSEECVANRIRANTIIVPEDSHQDSFAIMAHSVIEDQSIAGQVISIETEDERNEPMR